MQHKVTAYTAAVTALVALFIWGGASALSVRAAAAPIPAQLLSRINSAVEGTKGRLVSVGWKEGSSGWEGGKAVHLVVEARSSGDQRADLQQWDRVGQQLARAAFDSGQGASAAYVSIYYGEGTQRSQPALELVALLRSARQEPYRQKGYTQSFHAGVESFSSPVVVLVKYRFDVFALFRQSLVAVPALKGRP